MQIETVSIDDLKPYDGNPRRHGERQIKRLAESIRKFGWTIPVLATDDGTVVAGHGRLEAARRIGIAKVPVVRVDGWSDEQVRAYRILDNRLAELGTWDEDLLNLELAGLKDAGFDTDIFDMGDLEFEPELEPHIGDGVVTAERVERVEASPSSLVPDNSEGRVIKAWCPECGAEIRVKA